MDGRVAKALAYISQDTLQMFPARERDEFLELVKDYFCGEAEFDSDSGK